MVLCVILNLYLMPMQDVVIPVYVSSAKLVEKYGASDSPLHPNYNKTGAAYNKTGAASLYRRRQKMEAVYTREKVGFSYMITPMPCRIL